MVVKGRLGLEPVPVDGEELPPVEEGEDGLPPVEDDEEEPVFPVPDEEPVGQTYQLVANPPEMLRSAMRRTILKKDFISGINK